MDLGRDLVDMAMDEKQLEGQSRLLIELGEPESWLETMMRAARRSATHADDIGDSSLAGRWRNLTRALEYASAAAAHDPMTADKDQSPSDLEPSDTATQSQSNADLYREHAKTDAPLPLGGQHAPTADSQTAIPMPPPRQNQSPSGLNDTNAIIEGHRP